MGFTKNGTFAGGDAIDEQLQQQRRHRGAFRVVQPVDVVVTRR